MAIEFKFFIEESADANSFVFYDLTGDYDVNINPTGWGTPNFDYGDVTSASLSMRLFGTDEVIPIQLPLDATTWVNGIDIPRETKLEDGAYEFKLIINDETVATRDFGFYAQIKEEVMFESLSYRPERERVYRELIWEKMRLLDNLFYATETNQIKHFQENLAQLIKLK